MSISKCILDRDRNKNIIIIITCSKCIIVFFNPRAAVAIYVDRRKSQNKINDGGIFGFGRLFKPLGELKSYHLPSYTTELYC